MSASVFQAASDILLTGDIHSLQENAETLAGWIPELSPMIGFDQHSPHHAYDVYTHTAHVTAAVPGDLTLKWAALLHDVGKVPCFTRDATGRGHFKGHAAVGADMAEEILLRLQAPDALREQAVWLVARHMTRLKPDPEALRLIAERHGPEAVNRLIILQEADMSSKGTAEDGNQAGRFAELRRLLKKLTENHI